MWRSGRQFYSLPRAQNILATPLSPDTHFLRVSIPQLYATVLTLGRSGLHLCVRAKHSSM